MDRRRRMIQRPTYDEVQELPAQIHTSVRPERIDANGHLNVRGHLSLGSQAMTALMARVGIDDDYRRTRRLGVFSAEHHLRYFSELSLDQPVSVHARILERSATAVHLMAFLADTSRRQVASTVELLLVHVGLDVRGALPIPADIASGLDVQVDLSRDLGWDPPVCGVMGIRR